MLITLLLVTLAALALVTRAWLEEKVRADDLAARLDASRSISLSAATGLLLPGFFCAACRIFTGDAKERHTHCRSCGKPRPPH